MKKHLAAILLFLLTLNAFSQGGNTTTLPSPTTSVALSQRIYGTLSDSLRQFWFNTPNVGWNRFYSATEVNKFFKLKSDSTANSGYVTHGYFNAHAGGSVNIYNSNGTITSNRTVTITGKSLTFGDFTKTGLSISDAANDLEIQGGTGQSNASFNSSNVGFQYGGVGIAPANLTLNSNGIQLNVADITTASINQSINVNTQGIFLTDSINNRFPRVTHHYPYHPGSLELPDTKTIDSLISAGGGNTIYTGDGTLTGNRSVNISTHSLAIGAGNLSLIMSNAGGASLAYSNNQFSVAGGGITQDVADVATGLKHNKISLSTNGIFVSDTLKKRGILGTSYYGRNSLSGNQYVQLRLLDSTAKAKGDSIVTAHPGTTYSAGNGLTLTGTIFKADTTVLQSVLNFFPKGDTRYYTKTIADGKYALQATTISAGNGLSGGGSLAANRTLTLDTAVAVSKTFAGRYPLKSTTIAGFDLRNNITLASLTPGYGITGSAYAASTGQTWKIDTVNVATRGYVNGKVASISPVYFSSSTISGAGTSGSPYTVIYDSTPTSGSLFGVTSGGVYAAIAAAGGSSFYQTVKNQGTGLTQRANLNTAYGLIASDNSPNTDLKADSAVVQTVLNFFPKGDTRYYTKTAADAKYGVLTANNSWSGNNSFSGTFGVSKNGQVAVFGSNAPGMDNYFTINGATSYDFGVSNSNSNFFFAHLGTHAFDFNTTGQTAIGGASTSTSTWLILPASSTSVSSLRLPHGSAPTSPVNGDMWTTTANVFARINGTTQALAPLASPTFTGTPAAPTATAGTNTTQLATTAFVTTAINNAVRTLRLTGSGTGAATTISIAHGLTGVTSASIAVVSPINAASSGISYITCDATNVNIVYTAAPVSGTNNLSYNVVIKP